jgi:outer membrane biosynthesis protein TonB
MLCSRRGDRILPALLFSHSRMNRRQKVLVSLALSIGVHLLVATAAVFLVGFGSVLSSEQVEAKPPSEVVMYFPQIMVDAPPEPESEAEKEAQQFIRTGDENVLEEAPENAPFYSDKSTSAESEVMPDPEADNNLPSQDGLKDMPFKELKDREYIDGEEVRDQAGAPPTLAAAVVPPAPVAPPMELIDVQEPSDDEAKEEGTSDDLPAPTPLRERSFADALDMIDVRAPRESDALRETQGKMDEELEEKISEADEERRAQEKPVVQEQMPGAPTPPQAPAPETMPLPGEQGFTPHTRATSMRGSLSNTGKSASVLAEATPLGRYKQAVSAAIGRLWHRYRQDNMDFVVFGSLKLEFKVDRQGNPRNLRVTDNDANEIMANFSMRAVMDADIPPMPEEIIGILDDGMLEVTYDVIIY